MNFINARKSAFTLIELLVVIAIISILAAILFPVFARARENARRSSCLSNVKQIGLGFMQYNQDYDEQMPFNKTNATTGQLSWIESIQPYLKSKQILRCPSDTSENWETPIVGLTGDSGGLRPTSYVENLYYVPNATTPNPYANLASTQAPSKVIFMTESPKNRTASYFHARVYTDYPGGSSKMTLQPDGVSYLPIDVATAQHLEGFNAGYLDGHVKWVKWSQVWFNDPNAQPTFNKGSFSPLQQ